LLVSIAIVIAIAVLSMGIGLMFTTAEIRKTMESDMELVGKVADSLITHDIELIKSDAATVVGYVVGSSDDQLPTILHEQLDVHESYLALTVISRDGTMVSTGTAPVTDENREMDAVQKAFDGTANISTSYRDPTAGLVFYVCAPVSTDRILAITIPGMHFNDTLDDFQVWDTGYVFMIDNEGTFLASKDSEAVTNRVNLIATQRRNPSQDIAEAAAFFEKMLGGGSGVGEYFYYGAERVCAYRTITGSTNDWCIGVIAPVGETPLIAVQNGLLLSSLLLILLGVIVAMFLSRSIAKPFEDLEVQNVQLEELSQQAQNASETKSHFLANMSHEIRTPLNAVIGLSDLTLSGNAVQGEVRENLESIYRGGTTILGIVNDILDLSKIESGKIEIIPVDYDLASLINDTITLNIVRIGSKPIDFNLSIDEDLISRLYGDELRVKQILNNLLSNAFKYTEEGTVNLKIGTERSGDSVWLTVAVADTGIGIREKDIIKLFSDYNQVDTANNRKIEGTGLGLSIAKRMAQLMDGDIAVESVYGQGSTFTVRVRQGFVTAIPVGEDVARNLRNFDYSDKKRALNAMFVRVRIPYARVLVIDDVQSNLDVARGMMKQYALQVDCVRSGQEAIDLIRDGQVRYNALFMDHMMPGMDGIEATRIIREEIGTSYAREVPIIALTANAILGNEKMFLDNGFQAFLSKPIDIMRLDAVIRQWVRDKDLERALKEEDEDAFERRSGKDSRRKAERRSGLDRRDDGTLWKIDGLDLKLLVDRFGGDEGSAIEALRSYVVNTPELLTSLQAPALGNLPAYAINVHGLKGSSYGICAERIGKLAESLEYAAKHDKLDYITDNNDLLITMTEALIAITASMLDEIEQQNARDALDAPDPALLAQLAEASRAYSMDMVDEAITALDAYVYESGQDLVNWLKARAADAEFDAIAERLAQEDVREGATNG
jgi:signal transduction histidine kinase/DNA-binding response OmpR family regulator/HPt (histidine-containing phosphotransfer) domain-containing protein